MAPTTRGSRFAACSGASQPPGGALALMASSGCGSADHFCTASFAAASVCGSRWAATSSRFLAASPSPLLGRQREPLVGFGVVLLHADAAGVKDGEIVLAVGDAAIGGLAEPLRGSAVIGRAVDALGIEHREIVHRLAVALRGGRSIEVARHGEVLLHPDALFVKGRRDGIAPAPVLAWRRVRASAPPRRRFAERHGRRQSAFATSNSAAASPAIAAARNVGPPIVAGSLPLTIAGAAAREPVPTRYSPAAVPGTAAGRDAAVSR